MKTQINRLDFYKQTVTELNQEELLDIVGGSTPGCFWVSFGIGVQLGLEFF